MGQFAITGSKGFHITFTNGVTVSVQFGGGNYCDNYHMDIGSEGSVYKLTSGDAEVAMWDDVDDKWITEKYDAVLGNGGVIGHQTPEDVLKILNWAASYK